MEKIDLASKELKEMDELAFLNSLVHNLHPLAKLIVTVVYIFIVTSFNKYDLFRIFPMIVYPILMFEISGINIKTCFYKLRFVLPLVLMVGIINPFFDRIPYISINGIVITSGIISMFSLMLKGMYCVMASFIFVATTKINSICYALRLLHMPKIIVELVLLTYRYIGIMVDEVYIMNVAYKLRAPGQKGIKFTAWGSFLGQLLLRCMDRAEELYTSMKLRGFNGEFHHADRISFKNKDFCYLSICLSLFMVFRFINVSVVIGNLVMR